MSLRVHDFFSRYADQDVPAMIVDGDVIVAHVHHPEYLRLFLHAPEMVSLVEKLGAMECDPSRPEHDSESCAVCQARILLAIMQERAEAGLTADRSKLDVLG
jgi:hypothetical protein